MISSLQDGEAQDAREAADERVHGVGAGGAEAARRPISLPPQRRAQQDPRETVAVSAQFDYVKREGCSEISAAKRRPTQPHFFKS